MLLVIVCLWLPYPEDETADGWGCLHRWCGPRSSKPVAGVNNARCRFDSDTPPLRAKHLQKALFVVCGSVELWNHQEDEHKITRPN